MRFCASFRWGVREQAPQRAPAAKAAKVVEGEGSGYFESDHSSQTNALNEMIDEFMRGCPLS